MMGVPAGCPVGHDIQIVPGFSFLMAGNVRNLSELLNSLGFSPYMCDCP